MSMRIERKDPYLDQVIQAIYQRRQSVGDFLANIGLSYDLPPAATIISKSRSRTTPPIPDHSLPIVIELRPDANVNDFKQLQGLHVEAVIGQWITAWADLGAIDILGSNPNVARIVMSREGGRASAASLPPPDPLEACDVHPLHQVDPPELGKGVIAGVIDLGVELLHEAFLDDDGSTRLIAVWDQWGSGPPPPNFSYGTYYTQADIQNLLHAPATPLSQVVGRDPYHGTKVASIFAGRPVPNPAGHDFPGGVARQAHIVLVAAKIDSPKGDPKSVGYSKGHLDALSFIENEAKAKQCPFVVNMSLGMNAGAHDGTSPLELAFDHFTQGGTMPGRALVKSIGNERRNNLHARLFTITHGTNSFEWTSSSQGRWQDYIELWFASTDRHEFTLISPSGERVGPVTSLPMGRRVTQHLTYSDPGPPAVGRELVQMTLSQFHRDNGDSQLILSIQESRGHAIRPGDWKLEVFSTRVLSDGVIDAWIEVYSKMSPIRFVSNTVTDLALSIPATARSVITVGAVDSRLPATPAQFSSLGPTRDRREKPDVVAPGRRFVAADAGSRNGTEIVEGTSMASPIVAGVLALAMAKRLKDNEPMWNAAQLRAALRQTAKGYAGFWNTHFGCGVVSAEKLLEVLQ